jgi:hypothetical protein
MKSERTAADSQDRFDSVSFVTGEVTKDGRSILLRVQTEHGERVNLSVPTVDLQHVITLLLLLGGKAALNGQFAASSETFWARPLPLHGVTLGVDDDTAVLTIEVGATVLSFSLTAGSMAEIGRTIMTLTAPDQAN